MSDLKELAEGFAKHTECKLEMLDSGYGCTISLGPIDLRIMHQPGSEVLVFQLPVGILPENPELKLNTLIRLMNSNDLYRDTKGLTLGYNDTANLITLQNVWELHSLDQEKFSELVFRILNEGIVWMEKLDPEKMAEASADNKEDKPQEDNLKNAQWLSL
jgi:hypothetical protein